MAEDILVRLRQALPGLRPGERRIAESALADPAGVSNLSISELAVRNATSTTTVARFCRNAGFDGYKTFRLALARAAVDEDGRRVKFGVSDGDIDPADSTADVVRKLAYQEARAVEETATMLDLHEVERVVEAIIRAPVVDVYGSASSGLAAQDLQQKLRRIGYLANAWTDAHLALTSAAVLPPLAVAIGFSHSGERGGHLGDRDGQAGRRVHGGRDQVPRLAARSGLAVATARAYDAAGADAISVITERDHFLGELSYLEEVRAATSRPLLRKDFMWTRYQIAQSAAYGADCVLLIVAGMDDEALRETIDEAGAYALDVLAEAHDEDELRRAVAAGARLVGINNRNLRTLETDLAVSDHLLPKVPEGVFADQRERHARRVGRRAFARRGRSRFSRR